MSAASAESAHQPRLADFGIESEQQTGEEFHVFEDPSGVVPAVQVAWPWVWLQGLWALAKVRLQMSALETRGLAGYLEVEVKV